MSTLLSIAVVSFLIYAMFGQKKKPIITAYNSDNKNNSEKEVDINALGNIKVTVTSNRTFNERVDDSIIDITDLEYNVQINSPLQKYMGGVPFWKHQYIYSYFEIDAASEEQKKFYSIFKVNFLNDIYFDLEGNTNYSFILLFDFLDEYDKHQDINILSDQIKKLGNYYPKTKSYAFSYLIEKMEDAGEEVNVEEFDGYNRFEYNYYDRFNNSQHDSEYNYWKLGNRYKSKLNLKNDDVKILNNIWYSHNNFSRIEFCFIEIIKLFLLVNRKLDEMFFAEGTNLNSQLDVVADIIARKHFRYKKGSQKYKYSIESTRGDLYSHIFKLCENAVREYYGHKRKISTDTYYTNEEIKVELENRIISRVQNIFPELVVNLSQLDELTEIKLNTQNTTRWKIRFDLIVKKYVNNADEFYNDILLLGKLNKKNPSVENIFFEASKFIAKHDKENALKLYVYYLFHDLHSSSFDNKQLSKMISKSLFSNNDQLHTFEIIVSELVNDKNLEKALNNISKVYELKRKKIQLDKNTINEVQQKHSGTVELLNEFLKDDFENDTLFIKSKEINEEELKIEIISKAESIQTSIYTSAVNLTPSQIGVLDLFVKNKFSLLQSDIEAFARQNGLFKNQLIDNINEKCYDVLDDLLIEEDEDYYIINETYYHKILVK